MTKNEFTRRKSPFTELVGIKTVGQGKQFQLKVQKKHTNSHGYAHGGAIFSLADRAFACAVNTPGKISVAMEMKINYLSPVAIGDVLVARAKVIKEGKRTTVCLIEIKRKSELVAMVLATSFNVKH
ncbi:MAG: PaaI family thioesterase [bacterium]|nr:PaaI family thioesterase [bacterium]